jgi:outer membrane protein assembly factor BamD (BamD/ComL family)
VIARVLAATLFSSLVSATGALGSAPFQCARVPDDGARREDTAGDALYALAQRFKAENNAAAAHETLKYLVEHYPSSRYAPAAKDELVGERRGVDGG